MKRVRVICSDTEQRANSQPFGAHRPSDGLDGTPKGREQQLILLQGGEGKTADFNRNASISVAPFCLVRVAAEELAALVT
jgi:hypothetical protein